MEAAHRSLIVSAMDVPAHDAISMVRRAHGIALAILARGQSTRSNVESGAFRMWFGASLLIDEGGKPIVLYRGGPATDWETGDDIHIFASKNGPWAAFLTTDRDVASRFASYFDDGVVTPVYARVERPLIVDAKGRPARDFQIDASVLGKPDHPIREEFLSGDYDALWIKNTSDEGDIVVPRNSNQIKSALANSGAFSLESESILDEVSNYA